MLTVILFVVVIDTLNGLYQSSVLSEIYRDVKKIKERYIGK